MPSPLPSTAAFITADAALAAVQPFLAKGMGDDLTATFDDNGMRPLWIIDGAHFHAYVDARDGLAASVSFPDVLSGPNGIGLSMDDAQKVAAQWLADHGIAVVPAMRVTVERRDHGEMQEYVVTWQSYEGEVRVDDVRAVSIQAGSGHVLGFHQVRPASSAALPPVRLSREAAIKAALAATGFKQPKLTEEPYLTVAAGGGATGPFVEGRRVVWVVGLSEGMLNDLVWVDAENGKTAIVGRG
jgi:hypothetical protein